METERTNQAEGGVPRAITPRVIFGLFILALGAMLLLDNMGVVDIDNYWHYWPVFLIALGVAKLFQPYGRGFGLVILVVGIWALLDSLGYLEFNWHYVWPAILVLIGGSIVWRGVRGATSHGSGKADPSARVSAFAALGGAEIKSTSQDFRGGDATAIMGGCDLDLRQAIPVRDGAVIDTFAVWGGIDIKVPADWSVTVQGTPLLGGFSDSRRNVQPDPAKRLVVKGLAIMGGVEVKN